MRAIALDGVYRRKCRRSNTPSFAACIISAIRNSTRSQMFVPIVVAILFLASVATAVLLSITILAGASSVVTAINRITKRRQGL
jgi:hypothetical protein